jgi:hypothetical protein
MQRISTVESAGGQAKMTRERKMEEGRAPVGKEARSHVQNTQKRKGKY